MTPEEKLKKIAEIYDVHLLGNFNSEDHRDDKFRSSIHARHNLEGALYDLEVGKNDKVVHNTIRRVIGQLSAIEALIK